MKLNVLLYNIESDMNLGLVIRDCYMLGNGLVHLKIFDPKKTMQLKSQTIQRFSSYSVDFYKDIEIFDNLQTVIRFLASWENRVICTIPDEQATGDITKFIFENNDLIVFGNEYYGLPDEVLRYSKEKVVIPMYGSIYERPDLAGKVRKVGSQRCLSLSASVSISLFLAIEQLTGYQEWRSSLRTPRTFQQKDIS